jgi:2-oxoglutarate ferredoxin oxidoreductase subunit beta
MTDQQTKKISMSDFNSPVKPTWCPGCGNFAIFSALKQALIEQNLGPTDILMTFDIGCNGNGADKINVYGFKGLHGRSVPVAVGAKLANQDLPVIATIGDGGSLDEGLHHLVHSARSNYDITVLMHDNENFGLTTGQETPTTPKNQPMVASPWGVVAERLNPVQLALISQATFVAQAWTGNIKELKNLIIAAINHKGFSFVHILQHCPTYNKFEDQDWLRERVTPVDSVEGYDNSDLYQALKLADYNSDKRYTGIIYEDKEALPFMQRIPYRQGEQMLLKDEVKVFEINEIIQEFL